MRARCLKLGANTRTHNGTPAARATASLLYSLRFAQYVQSLSPALLSPSAKTAPPALPVLRLRTLTYALRAYRAAALACAIEAGEVEPRPGHALIGTPARLLALRANRHAGFAGAKATRRAMAASARPSATAPALLYLLRRPPWMEEMQKGCREQPLPCSRAPAAYRSSCT
jgi:hypothetical protein